MLAGPVLYVISFGPVCWWLTARTNGAAIVPQFYWPIGYVRRYGNPTLGSMIAWYATLGREGVVLQMPFSADGRRALALEAD